MTLLNDAAQPAALRVSQLAGKIRWALRDVGHGWVEGEVQGRRVIGGHTYFTLADEHAAVNCVVWRSRAARIRQWPAEGQLVQAHFEKVDFYPRRGSVSLHVDTIRLTGEGELLARKQATLDKLTAEGLVARARQPLPAYPRRVGVIAARDSDTKHDVIKALRERWPAVDIVFHPAFVEGLRAVDSVIAALARLQDVNAVDVIIVARGGGGVRDLVAFDDERLCRAVFACDVPVVTSIGHTAQRPNCDRLAAAFADVPARTAELVVPSATELRGALARHRAVLESVPKRLSVREHEVTDAWARARPTQALRRRATELNTAAQQLQVAAQRFFEHRGGELNDVSRTLIAARGHMPAPIDIDQLADRLAPATGRMRRRATDFEGTFARLREYADKAFARQLRVRDRDLDTAAAGLAAHARRTATDSQSKLDHIVELIAARDFRRLGWVLVGDRAGRPVGSTRDLTAGDALTLNFRDGCADAAVTDIHHNEGAIHA